jgi:hypothetical protein
VSATVDLALTAHAKSLALFHHDPMHSDEAVTQIERSARELIAARGGTMPCFAAAEGQSLTL